MNWRICVHLLRVLAFANLLAWTQPVEATSYSDRSLPELYETAGWLLSGSVESQSSECKQQHCLYKSTLDVKEAIKGSLGKAKICVCSQNPLEVRKSYLVFVVALGAKDTFGIECEYFALVDGVISPDGLGNYYRYMSPNGLGQLVSFEGDTYRTSEIRDPLFAAMLMKWKAAKLNAK